MSDEKEISGFCGWGALGLVLVLLPGLLPGSFAGGLAALQIVELFGADHAFELLSRLLILFGMIAGLLLSTLIIVAGTIGLLGATARLRQTLPCFRHGSVRKE